MNGASWFFGDEGAARPKGKFLFGNCWLYVCTGNEPAEYAYRFQEELATYVGLFGYHPLLLVGPNTGRDSALYAERATIVNGRLVEVGIATGLHLECPHPLCLEFESDRQLVDFAKTHGRAIEQGAEFQSLADELLADLTSVRYNQFTPMQARSLERFASGLAHPSNGLCELVEVARQRSKSVMRFTSKREYWNLVNAFADAEMLPRHLETKFIAASHLPPTWNQFVEQCCGDENGRRWIIKSERDACGDVTVFVDELSYADEIADLHEQLRNKSGNRNRPASENWFLVQRALKSDPQTQEVCGVPDCFGINCFIHDVNQIDIVCLTKQLYAEPQRRIHLGAYWSRDIEDTVLSDIGYDRIKELCRLFAREGYVGPVGFDGMRDDDGHSVLIYDCNPRLTGVLPVLAVRQLLKRHQVDVCSIANAGYHGTVRSASGSAICAWLNSQKTLFRLDNPEGVLPVPNFVSKDGTMFDLFFVNMTQNDVLRTVAECRDAGILLIPGVYI
jgi:hypothetical protein